MATDLKTGLKQTTLYDHALGCMLGGLIGDAIGTPTEGMDYRDIESKFGWIADFDCDGTDDTVMKVLLSRALIRTNGHATLDDWAAVWLDNWQEIFSSKMAKFFISVLHTAHKLRRHATPRMAALGNMPSSSSAMCISPVGIVNACNPRMAALQTYNLASLIHVQDVGFCQDGAVAMATAVAEAFRPGASVQSVLAASTEYILPASGAEMLAAIDAALTLARETGDFRRFREAAYERADSMFCRITCDSRETVPITLALFLLAMKREKLHTGAAMALAGFTMLTLTSARNIHFFGVIAPFILATTLTGSLSVPLIKRYETFFAEVESRLTGLVWPLSTVIFGIVLLVFSPLRQVERFSPAFFPVQAVQWLKENPQEGEMFNPFDWGGYLSLMLPEKKVFIDSQGDVYGETFIRKYEQVITIAPGWQDILDEYKVRWALVNADWPLAQALAAEGWQEVYRDNTAVILTRGGE